MGLLNFNKLPVNTLVGADKKTFNGIVTSADVDREYLTKYRITRLICSMLSSLKRFQDKRYDQLLKGNSLEHDPLFILGHWRSGTTFMHNVFAQDRHFGHNTTFQAVFPHLMMWGQSFFKKQMGYLMPDKRPTDNMELKPDLPQEEEFALANMMPYSYYNFWFLPKKWREYAHRYLLFDHISPEELSIFKETFDKLIKISLWNTGGTQFLSKNPPHTGRIKALLEMYPSAKFIYLIRNPYTVFESTRSFFTNTIRPLQLQNISQEEIEENILYVYKLLYDKYMIERNLIPEGNLYEIKFEDYEQDPMGMTEEIYRQLDLPGFDKAEADIQRYIGSKKSYKKNEYRYAEETVRLVDTHWAKALSDWQYK